MEQQKFQEVVLEVLKDLKEGQVRLEMKMDKLEEKVDRLDLRLGSLEQQAEGMDKRLSEVEESLGGLQQDMGTVKEKLQAIEVQVIENTEMLTDIKESMEYLEHKENNNEKEIYQIKKRLKKEA